ncbi:unnamed protein product [Callosobruchus maculatus]|uniref:Uncharacterized protein n=1 Tax=Callosobruchus maculatus TaxID=64391 RepID=A0A653DEY4_CALMS|nr:unnamed protein product [Callosobruchus maculatus]
MMTVTFKSLRLTCPRPTKDVKLCHPRRPPTGTPTRPRTNQRPRPRRPPVARSAPERRSRMRRCSSWSAGSASSAT